MHKDPTLIALLCIEGRALDTRLIALLRGVREHGSLVAAARSAGVSYRHAWGEVGRITSALGAPIVELQRGRGAALTPAGAGLLDLDQALGAALAAARPALANALAQAQPARTSGTAPVLRIHASHDFALASLRELAVKEGLAVELHFQGSLDALQALKNAHCEVAGFHVTTTPQAAAGLGPLTRLLRSRELRLIDFATRRQGLIVPRGKNSRVRTLADLAHNRVRFINRQPGSGTRLLFDRLLALEGIAARQIHGYRDEEFTHAAVAATIASGKADAGFGIEAAARPHGLKFIPIATERYLLAAHATTLTRPAMKNFCKLLYSDAFTRVLSKLPGYSLPDNHVARRVADTFTETLAAFR